MISSDNMFNGLHSSYLHSLSLSSSSLDGSCSNNSLSGSTAEGNTSHWTTNHPSLSDSIVTQSGGEKHFTLSPSGPVPDPSISQNLSFDRPGNYTLYFKLVRKHVPFTHKHIHTHPYTYCIIFSFSILRCRMRSSGLSTLPVIVLAPPSRPSLTVPLPFPSLTSWQWVSDSINFIVESPGSLSVIMATSQTGSGSFQSVFFDDLCANLVQEGTFYVHVQQAFVFFVGIVPVVCVIAYIIIMTIYFCAVLMVSSSVSTSPSSTSTTSPPSTTPTTLQLLGIIN